jgi:hypothetical protein
MKILHIVALAMIALSSVACTDAYLSQISALGEPGHIVCYSGGKVIYDGKSTGKIGSESGSDGWYLTDAATKKLVRVSGDCVIEN